MIINRIIKAMLLAAVLTLCFVNASIVQANADKGGGNSQRKGGWNGLAWNSGFDDPPRVVVRNPGPPRPIVPISDPPRAVAPEFDPRLFAGSVAILAGVLLLERHRRWKLKA